MNIGSIEELFTSSPVWLMAFIERIIYIGILNLLKPKTVLEIGVWQGAATHWIKKICDKVTCVDVLIHDDFHEHEGVEYLKMRSDAAFEILIKDGRKFDLCVIDAGHTFECAYKDLSNAMKISKVILLHDTYHTETGAGYYRAIKENQNILYYEIDKIIGDFYEKNISDQDRDGKWGGFGIVIMR